MMVQFSDEAQNKLFVIITGVITPILLIKALLSKICIYWIQIQNFAFFLILMIILLNLLLIGVLIIY